METSRIDGVKAPPHDGTPRSDFHRNPRSRACGPATPPRRADFAGRARHRPGHWRPSGPLARPASRPAHSTAAAAVLPVAAAAAAASWPPRRLARGPLCCWFCAIRLRVSRFRSGRRYAAAFGVVAVQLCSARESGRILGALDAALGTVLGPLGGLYRTRGSRKLASFYPAALLRNC